MRITGLMPEMRYGLQKNNNVYRRYSIYKSICLNQLMYWFKHWLIGWLINLAGQGGLPGVISEFRLVGFLPLSCYAMVDLLYPAIPELEGFSILTPMPSSGMFLHRAHDR
jgi:hypothetical protein